MAEENRLFQVEIITPDRVFYTGEGDMIEFTTASGEIGVYKKHIPLTTVLAPGIVKIHKTGEDDVIAAVHSGFAVTDNFCGGMRGSAALTAADCALCF